MPRDFARLLAGELRHTPLCQGIEVPEVADLLGRNARARELQRDDMLTENGNRNSLFCICHGLIKLSVICENGTERVIRVLEHGDTIGAASLFTEREPRCYAQALADTTLIELDRDTILACAKQYPQFSLRLLTLLSENLAEMLQDIENCSLRPAQQRVARYLLDRAAARQRDSRPGDEVVLPTCKAVIASSLNLTPETFSRELHQLSRSALIRIEGRTIHIRDAEGLQRRTLHG